MDEREQFVRGTLTGALLVSAAAVVGLLVWGRAGWAFGFAIGAGVSLGNFWLVATAVTRLASAGGPAGWAGLWRGSLARFGIVGLVLVLALVVFKVSLAPLVAGLLLAQVWMVGHWLWSSIRALT
jgi:hypothetical protein